MWSLKNYQARPLNLCLGNKVFRNLQKKCIYFNRSVSQIVTGKTILLWHSRQKVVLVIFFSVYWLLDHFCVGCFLWQFVFAMAYSYLSRWFKLWLTFGILYFFTGNFIDSLNDAKMAIDKRPLSLSAILAGNLYPNDEGNIRSYVENRKTKTQWKPVKPKTTAFNLVEDGKFKSYSCFKRTDESVC